MSIKGLLFIVLTIAAFQGSAQFYTYKNFNHRNGLVINSVMSVCQANDGGVLIGTQGAGIIEYDGYKFSELLSQEETQYHVSKIITIGKRKVFLDRYKGVFEIDKNAKVKLLLRDKLVKEYYDLIISGDSYYVIHKNGIQKINKGKHSSLLRIKTSDEPFRVTQKIETDAGVFILSNYGNYILSPKNGSLDLLDKVIQGKYDLLRTFKFGYTLNGRVYFYNEDFTKEYCFSVHSKAGIKFINEIVTTGDAVVGDVVKSTFNPIKNCFTVINENGRLFELKISKINAIQYNFTRNINQISELITDYNGDYWVGSWTDGLFKLSEEPFTKINFTEGYRSKNIIFTYTASNGVFFYSTSDGGTRYGRIRNLEESNLPYAIFSVTKHKGRTFFATENGVIEYLERSNSFQPLQLPFVKGNEKVQLVFSDDEYLWISSIDKGIHKYHLESKEDLHYTALKHQSSDYCYTAQVSKDKKYVYVGGNNGIFKYDLVSDRASRLPLNDLGYYCGISTTDVFGNNWFCMEDGIVGIINGEIKKIQDKKYFPSKLFYTINNDPFGNLLIGTNKGISLLKLNDEGKIIKQATYDAYSGFDGYETNMRSSSQNVNEVYFGTVEGLFHYNSTIVLFMEAPKLPCIKLDNSLSSTKNGIVNFEVTSKNPKTRLIYHSYRILEISEKWRPISSLQNYSIDNLANGEYTLEVKSTYDGFIFSEIASKKIRIEKPFYQSTTFLVLMIFLILLVNIFLLVQSNRREKKNSFLTDEYFIVQRIAPNLILFGTIALIMLEFILQQLNVQLTTNFPLTIIVGFILLSLYFVSINNKINRNIRWLKQNLVLAFTVLLGYCMFMLYENNLHPYYAFAIFLITSVTPFIFNNIRYAIIFGICFVFLCLLISFSAKEPLYDSSFFMISVIIDALLFIMMTYMRNDSIHKLAFISAVVNKGNIPTIAFDNQGTITYASKNIEYFTGLSDDDLANQNITILNQFIASIHEERINDIRFFSEGFKKTVVPMINPDQELIWMEWSFTKFSESVNVIFGQNVSERIQLQNTYEQLVQNAEDYIYQVDVNGVFTFVNDRFYDRLNYPPNELVGRLSLDVVEPEYRQFVLEFYQNHFSTRKQYSYLEFPIISKSGETIWLGQYVSTLFSPSQPKIITGFLSVGRDITLKRAQEEIIRTQNTSITASINYAKRIQMNLLPSQELMDNYFKESFVFFKPKDIVSGDFYWVRQIGDYTVIVIGDSTGHGVPGAFMSLLGINLLNSIIHEKQLLNPGRTLDEFDIKLRESLPKENNKNSVNDGMELTICVLNSNADTMLYACAGSKFLVHDGESFSLFKGDNKHIGDDRPSGFNGYVTHHAVLPKNSTLYLFTDGFQDQFGGRKEKKYSLRRLLELLEENIRLPLAIQSQMINEEFDNWKGDEEQTDDVTVIAIRKKDNT